MLDQLQWARAGVPVSVARMPFLIVRSGPRAGERIELVAELVVGRENADVTVGDEEVSRRHLAVRPHEDGVELEDLGSTNGTFVDGARLSAVVVVSSSARVILGETELEIEVEEPEPQFDPGATRLRDRPPERDATIVGPVPPRPRAAPAEPRRAAPVAGAAVAGDRSFRSLTPASPTRPRGGGATRQFGAAGIVFLVIVATAIALIVYFAAR
jgi:pSer/pThr/pTyr-binding forkhead associated (FHA) protein